MTIFAYNYDHMLQWYRDNLDNTNYFEDSRDVVAFVIEENPLKEVKKFKAKKPKKGPAQRYTINRVKDTIRKMKMNDANTELYPLGLYSILVGNALYVTFPNMKQDVKKRQHIFGDHFSFCKDTNVKEKRINLHVTLYKPDSFNVSVGYYDRQENYFMDGIELPLAGYGFDGFQKIEPFDTTALDLARVYKTDGKSSVLKGGTRRGKTMHCKDMKEVSTDLQQILVEQKVQKVFAVAYKADNGWDFSVYIYTDLDELVHSGNESIEDDESTSDAYYLGYGFSCRNVGIEGFQKKLLDAMSTQASTHLT